MYDREPSPDSNGGTISAALEDRQPVLGNDVGPGRGGENAGLKTEYSLTLSAGATYAPIKFRILNICGARTEGAAASETTDDRDRIVCLLSFPAGEG